MDPAPAPVQLPPRYEATLDPVGRGGFGTVFRTWDRELDIPVAVKVAHAGDDARLTEEIVRAMAAELRASACLRHPGFVQILDAGQDPRGRPWLAMEYATEGSIERWLEAGPPPWEELRPVLVSLLDAIGYAHARGLIHRDIKPQNVLLTDAGDGRLRPLIADFGLAKIRQRKGDFRSTRLLAGTLLYMAPETFEATSAAIHPTADLYAFGVLVHRLLSTEEPWDAEGISLVLEKTRKPPRPLRPLPGYPCPPGLPDLVSSLLRRKPDDRPQLAADVRRSLLALDSGGARRAAFPPAPTRPRLPCLPVCPVVALQREPALVGREDARARLWEAARASGDGALGLSLLGASGAGRSRLCSWLGRQLEEAGVARTVELRVEPDDSPGLALLRAVRRLLGVGRLAGADLEARVRDRARALALSEDDARELLSWLSPPAGARASGLFGAGAPRLGLFAALLAGVARRGRVLVWIEDRSEERGAALASDLLQTARLDRLPLLLLYEPPGGRPSGPDGFDELHLGPLPDGEVLALLQDLAPFAPELEGEALEARGNPQTAVEAARLLAALHPAGIGPGTPPSGPVPPIDRPAVSPASERLATFIEGEEREIRQTLASLLALLPRPCPEDDLSSAWTGLGREAASLDRALDASLGAGLVHRTDAGEYDLRGAQVARAAARVLEGDGRLERIAEACAATILTRPDPASRLAGARMLRRAGALDRAAHESAEAGRTLEGQDAAAARAAWELAIDCLVTGGVAPEEPRRVAATLGLARLLRGTFALAEAAALLDGLPDGLPPAQRAERRELRAGVHLLQGDAERALEEARSAADLYRTLDAPGGRSRALLLAADATRRGGRHADALPLFEQALEVAREAGLEREELGALWRLGYARLWGGGRDPETRARVRGDLELALELATRLRAGNFEGIVLRELGNLAVLEGRSEQAEELLRRSIGQLRRCGLDGEAATTRISLGELARARGDLEGARREYSIALGVTRSFGFTQDQLVALIDLVMTELALGRPDSLERRLAEIDALVPPDRPHVHRPYIEAVRFGAHVALGHLDLAEQTFEVLARALDGARSDRDLLELVERAADGAQAAEAVTLAIDAWGRAERRAGALGDGEAVERLGNKARGIG